MTVVRPKRPWWLKTWEQIQDRGWKDILLGNGASIAIHPSFRYPSLLEVAKKPSCPNHLKHVDVKLFKEFGTNNFERILQALYQSERVNDLLGVKSTKHRERYEAIRRALVGAIGKIHPEFHELDKVVLKAASDFLSNFKRVFTTNYDLLLYWTIIYNKNQFKDYFWGGNGVFDFNNTEVLGDKTRVYYLHGALFLFATRDGGVRKIKAQRADLLTRIYGELQKGEIPVFVSEGTAEQKRAAIRRHDYLTFAFGALRSSNDHLVIFGNSLRQADRHVVAAIRASHRETIAYSVYRERTSSLGELREKVKGMFPKKEVLFFDSETFPIYDD